MAPRNSSAAARLRGFARSTIGRFVGLAFLCQFLVSGGVLLFVQQASQRAVVAADRRTVEGLRDELLRVQRARGLPALQRAIKGRLSTVRGERIVLLLTDARGRVLIGNLGAWPATIPYDSPWQTIDLYRVGNDRPEPIGVRADSLPGGGRLLTGIATSNSLQLSRIYEEALSIAFVMTLALTLGIAILLGRVLARQVSAIADTANAVAVGALDRRVETDGSADAFDRLGQSINAMLERIDALVTQLRMMTDGLAHDLKSPVTRLISVVEQASAQTRDDMALDALEKVHREARALQSMLSTALLISRTEAGFGGDRLLETDIGALLRDLGEVYGPLVEDSGFALSIDAPDMPPFPLHRELVSQALANLIDNALTHAEGGDHITLSAERREEGAWLAISVADNGPGIAEEQRAAALKRFGRLDPSRSKSGSGLGLSLAEAVGRLHQGRIELSDNRPGLCATLLLRRHGQAFRAAG
ncbi:sensor histidine kinase [Sphingobium cloacae]|uniref:histidine kinase n=1 Tax=Sphingobium cloacae TaxID=120107 RepID=A0A1E1F3G2_9SPHN|nr:HAMP domain-containing sensor histidine kinase [Sphingobium cloacae]BAV65044.1 signal transduction histidine kinase [Sphingobium cloacae]